MASISTLPDNVTIISGNKEEIQTNKYLLSLFSPTLHSLLSTLCCISPTIILPDCSTFSIQYLLDIFRGGKVYDLSLKESRNVEKVAEILSGQSKIDNMIETFNDKIEPQNESIMEVMDNLSNIFDREIVELSITKEPEEKDKTVDLREVKRKRNEEHEKCKLKILSCEECEYKTNRLDSLKQHVESKHEGVHYSCSQCDYKATRKFSLKRHIESIHEGVCCSCSQCTVG